MPWTVPKSHRPLSFPRHQRHLLDAKRSTLRTLCLFLPCCFYRIKNKNFLLQSTGT
jgi:hypothetical protein